MLKRILSRLILITILNRLLLFTVAWLAVLYLPFREHTGIQNYRGLPHLPFLDGWTRWDGGWYVSIATQGYHFVHGTQSNVAFFPLYPLVIKFFLPIFKEPYLTGIIVSNCAFIVGIIFFHKLLTEHIVHDEYKSFWSILFLIFSPYSFFFSAVYSESLFFMCAVLCFYCAERKNWFFSGFFGMLTCADRLVGIALFPAIVFKYLESSKERATIIPEQTHRTSLSSLSRFSMPLFIGLIPLGLIIYMLFLYFKFGNPIAFANTIGMGWEGMKTMNPNPLLPFISFAETIFNFSTLSDNKYHVIFQFPIFLFFLVLTIYSFKYLGVSYGIFSLTMLAIPASVSIDLISMGRYMLVIFPCFAVIPEVIRNRYLRILIIPTMFFFLTLFTAMFATFWWVA